MVQNTSDTKLLVKKAFEIIAKDWDRLREKPWPVLRNFFEQFDYLNLFQNDYLLDLGCGNGRHSLLFSDMTNHVIGVDFSLNLLKIAKKKISQLNINNISYVMADITLLPFKDEAFSSIIYLSTLHHIPTKMNRLNNLMDISRILKQDGRCLISVWRRWQKRFFWHFFKQLFKPSHSGDFGDINIPWKKQDGVVIQRFYHLFSQRELKKLIQKFGLQIVLMKNFGGPTKRDNIFVLVKK